MALPELFLPSTLPDFKAAGHKATPEKLYGAVERQGGTARKRRLYTSTPRMLEAQLEVTQEQLETFVSWHEDALQAGSLPFAARVAKVGSGVEYWEAFCLSFKVDHQEGSTHLLSLELRLKGTPYDTLPTLPSMAAEFAAALAFQTEGGYAYGLSADFLADLSVLVEEGAYLSAEFLGRLDIECSGALANPSLLAEFEVYLGCYSVVGTSAALAAEFSAGLDALTLDVPQLAVEFSAGLDCSTVASSSLGYRNPSAVSVSADYNPFKQHVTARLRLLPDGSVFTKEHTLAYDYIDTFYSPVTATIATGKWVKAVLAAGDAAMLFPAPGVSRQFNTSDEILWTLTAEWYEAPVSEAVTLTIMIANDPDFLDVISTFTADLAAQHLG